MKLAFRIPIVLSLSIVLPLLLIGIIGANSLYKINLETSRLNYALLSSRIEFEINNFTEKISAEFFNLKELIELYRMDEQEREIIINHFSLREKDVFETGMLSYESDYISNEEKKVIEKNCTHNEVYFGEMKIDQEGVPYFIISVKIINPFEGNYCIYAVVSAKKILRQIQLMKVGETGMLYMVDKAGKIFFHPDISRIFMNTNIDKEKDFYIAMPTDSKKVVISVKRINFKDLQIVIQQDYAEVFNSFLNARRFFVILIISFTIIALIFGIVHGRGIIRSVNTLLWGTTYIAKGDLDRRIDLKTKDEFAQLAQAFNKMIEDLKISQEELIQKRVLAEIGETTTKIAHEIKNPLTALKACMQMLQETPDDKELQKKYFEITEPALDRIEKFLKDMLQYTRKFELDIKTENITEIISNAVNLKVAELSKQGVEINFESDQKDLTLQVDKARIFQVLLNLIDNARDAVGKQGKIEIVISKEKDYCKVEVRDNGEGISESIMKRIFEPFVSFKESGSGLGIPICKKIIKAHKGKMEISSKINEGTTVRLYLPI